MMRRILLSLAVAIPSVFLLTGAVDSCTETTVTPNPGGMGSMVQGNGSYTLLNTYKSLEFNAQLVGLGQTTSGAAAVDRLELTWTGTLYVAPADYDCWGTLYTIRGMTVIETDSNIKRVTVN